MIRIVIDTSVACAAGERGAEGTSARPALDALIAVERGAFAVVFSRELLREWGKSDPESPSDPVATESQTGARRQGHASRYAKKWLASMISERRLHLIDEAWPEEERLLAAAATLLKDGRVEAVAKDAHVVRAAMVTDRRVVSLDRKQRACLCALRQGIPELKSLYWVLADEAIALPWLRGGADPAPALTLENCCPPSPPTSATPAPGRRRSPSAP